MGRTKRDVVTYDFAVRSAGDPVLHGWAERARQAGLVVARRSCMGGRIQWSISSKVGRLLISQIPEAECRCTLLGPSLGQLEVVRKLRDAGLILPRSR